MNKTLTKKQVKEMLTGKKIVNVELEPYVSIVLDDNSELEIIPEQLDVGGVTYLDLSFKHIVGSKKDDDCK